MPWYAAALSCRYHRRTWRRATPTPHEDHPMSAQLSTALVPYLGPGDDGATAWLRLSPAERRRTAMQAARDHDTAILWSLTEAWLRSFGRVGAAVSPATIRGYRTGVHALLHAWTKEDVLHPGPDAATLYLRQLERRGLAASTIQARLAAARGLYSGAALVPGHRHRSVRRLPRSSRHDSSLG